jgi:adenosylcobinamide-GDP ribazoletransferase
VATGRRIVRSGCARRASGAVASTVRIPLRGVKEFLRASIVPVTGLIVALRYLSIVPVPGRRGHGGAPDSLADLGRAAVWFPVVGLGLGCALALVQGIAGLLFPALLMGLLTIAAWKILTGGLHLDGLADCLDGLAGRDAERRLAIMRDSRIGTFGAVGLVLVLLLDVAALADIPEDRRWRVLVVAPTVARATPLVLARAFPPARHDGQGAAFQASVGRAAPLLGVALAALVSVAMLGWAGLVAIVSGILAALAVGALLTGRLGGITGDVLGAAVEIAELSVLLTGAAWAGGRP